MGTTFTRLFRSKRRVTVLRKNRVTTSQLHMLKQFDVSKHLWIPVLGNEKEGKVRDICGDHLTLETSCRISTLGLSRALRDEVERPFGIANSQLPPV